jgi:hypothetical protein
VADFGRDKGRLQFPGKPSPSQNGAARATNKTFCLQAAASVAKGCDLPGLLRGKFEPNCGGRRWIAMRSAVFPAGAHCAISGEGVGLGHASPEDRYA